MSHLLNKTVLNVSFKDKDKVKKLGAKWDPAQKAWYIPPGKDEILFDTWLPKKSNKAPIVINNIGIARNIIKCWSCKGICTVCALYARELKDYIDSEDKTGLFFITELEEIPDSLADFLTLRCPNYRYGKINNNGYKLYRNHCDHCAMGISDAQLHSDSKKSRLQVQTQGFNANHLKDCKTIEFIDLLFFDNLSITANYIDYSNHALLNSSVKTADYLLDFI